MENNNLKILEDTLKELNIYEKKGLDTSSLKIFIRNFKEFLTLNEGPIGLQDDLTFETKLEIIKSFLEDKKAFPTTLDIINFVNDNLQLDFKDQKESRNLTISRIISRIKSKPELKDKLKLAVLALRNEMVHSDRPAKTKKLIISSETFLKWAEIIKNI